MCCNAYWPKLNNVLAPKKDTRSKLLRFTKINKKFFDWRLDATCVFVGSAVDDFFQAVSGAEYPFYCFSPTHQPHMLPSFLKVKASEQWTGKHKLSSSDIRHLLSTPFIKFTGSTDWQVHYLSEITQIEGLKMCPSTTCLKHLQPCVEYRMLGTACRGSSVDYDSTEIPTKFENSLRHVNWLT